MQPSPDVPQYSFPVQMERDERLCNQQEQKYVGDSNLLLTRGMINSDFVCGMLVVVVVEVIILKKIKLLKAINCRNKQILFMYIKGTI